MVQLTGFDRRGTRASVTPACADVEVLGVERLTLPDIYLLLPGQPTDEQVDSRTLMFSAPRLLCPCPPSWKMVAWSGRSSATCLPGAWEGPAVQTRRELRRVPDE